MVIKTEKYIELFTDLLKLEKKYNVKIYEDAEKIYFKKIDMLDISYIQDDVKEDK